VQVTPLSLLLSVASLPVLVGNGYLGLLTLLSARRRPPSPPAVLPTFDVFVPAHNEEQGIPSTVQSLLGLDYPKDLYRVVVIADNCSDATADRARAAGAEVLVRDDPELRGKGYALAHAFAWGRAHGRAAAVVIDADTLTSANLLTAFAARLSRGEHALQADYRVRNPEASWRTRLMAVALSTFHGVRSLGRERLGVSCGLRGNGMCFTYAVLERVPHRAFSIVEDLEYGLLLGRSGQRVAYVPEAPVFGEMVAGEKASRSQRQRWEAGRRALRRAHGWPLLRRACADRSLLLFDLGMDLLVPPLATVAVATAAGLVAAWALVTFAGESPLLLLPWALGAAALVVHVLRGWVVSGTGLRGLGALLCAPVYVAWKVWLRVRAKDRPKTGIGDEPTWVRTDRGA
jgi:cellulose synthase/poly-beta-1,6-N-acetylglucosamine synthase-like glycosyltransferase